MNEQAMEQLGKLVMDPNCRKAFFRAQSAASEAPGIRLTDHGWSAQTRIRPGALAAFGR